MDISEHTRYQKETVVSQNMDISEHPMYQKETVVSQNMDISEHTRYQKETVVSHNDIADVAAKGVNPLDTEGH